VQEWKGRKMNNFNEIFSSLKAEAKLFNYRVIPTTGRTEVHDGNKEIRIKYYVKTMENLYCFCHELGHIKDTRCDNDRYKNSKTYRIYIEIKAWFLGYEYVKKYKLPITGYVISAFKHLKTYIVIS
jgi:hypothetical protein